jgi:hypothetical protein
MSNLDNDSPSRSLDKPHLVKRPHEYSRVPERAGDSALPAPQHSTDSHRATAILQRDEIRSEWAQQRKAALVHE